jgi:hypothetical protein
MCFEQLKEVEMARFDFVYLTINGKKGTLAYWAKHYDISYVVFRQRYHRHGDNLAKLTAKTLTQKGYAKKKYKVLRTSPEDELPEVNSTGYVDWYSLVKKDGRTQSIKEWCVELGLNLPAVRRRIERGVRGEALLDPVREHISHKMGMKNMREHEARIRLEKEKAEPRLVMF